MASINAQPVVMAQTPATKQTRRRIVPVVPRQLARPRKIDNPLKEPPVRAAPKLELNDQPKTEQATAVDSPSSKPADVSKNTTVAQPGTSDQAPSETKTEQNDVQEEAQVDQVKEDKAKKQPAQLPPSFVPSHKVQSSLSRSQPDSDAPPSSSSQNGSRRSPRPSADGIVFGGYKDSLSASPAVAVPNPSSSMFELPPNPPHFVGVPPMQHLPHQYVSKIEPEVNVPHPDHAPPASFHPQQPHPEWMPSQMFQPMPYPPPRHVNGVNHMSRSPSQTSTIAMSHNSNSGIVTPDQGVFDLRVPHMAPFPARSDVPLGAPPMQPQSPPSHRNVNYLTRFLLEQFGSYNFADHVLHFATGRTFPVHGLLLARSSRLQAIMSMSKRDDVSSLSHLNIPTDYYFKKDEAFIDAIRYLYGGELLDFNRLVSPPQLNKKEAQNDMDTEAELAARMAYVLSYVAAGLAIDVSDVHFIGISVAERILCWQTLEVALDFALNSQFKRGIAGQHIMRSVINYIVMHFPVGFSLDVAAPQLTSIPRLPEQQFSPQGTEPPVLPGARRLSHHRLKSIRFGDAPTKQGTSYAASVLSSLLLSLPFDVLEELFASLALRRDLGNAVVAQTLHTLIAERERRRQWALDSHGHSVRMTNGDASLWEVLHLREAVEPSVQHASGLKLVRNGL